MIQSDFSDFVQIVKRRSLLDVLAAAKRGFEGALKTVIIFVGERECE